jgi:hypothetical protein
MKKIKKQKKSKLWDLGKGKIKKKGLLEWKQL